MNSWFETHAHLSDSKFDSDREAAIEAAFSAGVEKIVEIADGPEEWNKAQQLAEKYPNNLYWAAGIHPYYADHATPENLKRLAALASHPQFVAVGESGLDYAKSSISKEVQLDAFKLLLHATRELNKPLVIHCREAFQDMIPILEESFHQNASKVRPGVVHCFTGGAQEAAALVKLGFFLGVDGPISYPSANSLRAALKEIPLEHLVLETDSPYLPPQPYRGKRNEPKFIPMIAESLANLHQVSLPTLKQICLRNSLELFRLPTL